MKNIDYGTDKQARKAASIFRNAAEKMVECGVEKDAIISALIGVSIEGMLAESGEDVTVAYLADLARIIHKKDKKFKKKNKWSGFFNA